MSSDTKAIIATIVATAIGLAGLLLTLNGGTNRRIDDVHRRIDDVQRQLGGMTDQLRTVEERLRHVEIDVAEMKRRLLVIDGRSCRSGDEPVGTRGGPPARATQFPASSSTITCTLFRRPAAAGVR